LTKPDGLVPVVAAIAEAVTDGAVVSYVNVCEVTGDCTFSASSVARDDTVYEPSAGKLDAENAYVQLDVPLATTHTCVALEKALPFQ
jgi:hypothetical protein